jgi:hypothetical protein
VQSICVHIHDTNTQARCARTKAALDALDGTQVDGPPTFYPLVCYAELAGDDPTCEDEPLLLDNDDVVSLISEEDAAGAPSAGEEDVAHLFMSSSDDEVGDIAPAPVPAASSAGVHVPAMDAPSHDVPPPLPPSGSSSIAHPTWGESRNPAAFVVFVKGGKVSFYRGKTIAEAVCRCPAHGKCVLTRTLNPSAAPAKEAQGRPLGLLAGWLAKGDSCLTKEAHWAQDAMPTLAERQAAREALQHLGTPDADGLLASERPLRPGETDEPVLMP